MKQILQCPQCGGALDFERFHCRSCGKPFTQNEKQFSFVEVQSPEVDTDWLNQVKERTRQKYPALYPAISRAISPVYSPFPFDQMVRRIPGTAVVVNLGSGTKIYNENVINQDLFPYRGVQIVSKIENLPFQNNSIDYIINSGVLEHVPDPQLAVREMERVLKPGGMIYCFVPFIQGFHAAPYDFQRYTEAGLRELFKDFEIDQVRAVGPTSGMLWIVQEWLAMLFSFGSLKLYKLLLPLSWILSPLKYLDFVLEHHAAATNIATGHYIFVKKKLT